MAGEVTGLNVCLKNVAKVKKQFEDGGAKALDEWGKKTMNKSKDSFCPVDTGEMKATGDTKLEKSGDHIEVTLYYNTDYAPTVHEKPAYHPIGQSGFLRIPFNQGTGELQNDLQKELSKGLK